MSEKQRYIYKIRDRETGLYSKGGGYPSFGKNGKIWISKAALKSHLAMLKKNRFIIKQYQNCEIIRIPILAEEIDDHVTAELEKMILDNS